MKHFCALLVLFSGAQGFRAIAGEAPQAGYIDSARCATCHAEIAKRYAKTAMAHYFSAATPAGVGGDFTTHNHLRHAPSNRDYAMLRRADGYYERRNQT